MRKALEDRDFFVSLLTYVPQIHNPATTTGDTKVS